MGRERSGLGNGVPATTQPFRQSFQRFGHTACLFSAFNGLGLALLAQQPYTEDSLTTPTVNATYVQGVGPGFRPSRGPGLTLNIAAGTAFCNSTIVDIPSSSIPLVANTTNYAYLNSAAGCTLASNTSGFSVGYIPIAIAVTDGSSITPTGLRDVRNWFQPFPNIRFAELFGGANANAGEKIQACINALPSPGGGTCDARAFEGSQTINSALTVGTSTKPVTLLLGNATFITSAPITVAKGSQVIGSGIGTVIESGIASATSCGLTSSTCSTIIVASEHVVLKDFQLTFGGPTGSCISGSGYPLSCSIGIDIGVGASGVGHHIIMRNVEVTRASSASGLTSGFSIGIRVQRTFYGGSYDVDSNLNLDYNWLITNLASSNDYYNVSSRGANENGQSVTQVGIRIDDATANSASQRFHGGTIEGAAVQQLDVVGADYTLLSGTHVESLAPNPITGNITLTQNQNTMSGTSLDTQLKAGQYVKLSQDSNDAWMRIETIGPTSATLSDNYQGAGGTAAGLFIAGNIRVGQGTSADPHARRNFFLNPQPAVGGSGENGAPSIYVQAGLDNAIEFAGEIPLVIIFGFNSNNSRVYATDYSALTRGVIDLGAGSQVLGHPAKNLNYIKVGRVRGYSLDSSLGAVPIPSHQLPVSNSIAFRVGSLTGGLNIVSFSATPTFNVLLGNTQKITLSGNVTSSTLTNAIAGQQINFVICQDASGGHTFQWPTNVRGGMTIGASASTCSAQSFIFDGTLAYALSSGVPNM